MKEEKQIVHYLQMISCQQFYLLLLARPSVVSCCLQLDLRSNQLYRSKGGKTTTIHQSYMFAHRGYTCNNNQNVSSCKKDNKVGNILNI